MTRIEFMTQLSHELNKRKLPDAVEIVEEYEQHFAFKLTDGYSEAEIAAKLGSPVQLAAQFDAVPDPKVRTGRRVPVAMGLGVADLFAGIFFVFLIGWALVSPGNCSHRCSTNVAHGDDEEGQYQRHPYRGIHMEYLGTAGRRL